MVLEKRECYETISYQKLDKIKCHLSVESVLSCP